MSGTPPPGSGAGPPPVPGARTDEERERARREREARRAARAGAAGGAGDDGPPAAEPPTPAADPAEPRPPVRERLLGPVREHRREQPQPGPATPPPTGPGAPTTGHRFGRRGAGGGTPGASRIALGAAVALLALLFLWFLLSLFQPFKGRGDEPVRVVIQPETGLAEIADLLERREVVSSSFFFELRARMSGNADDLKPGAYPLRRGMSNGAAVDALAAGPPRNVVMVTLPEGQARREVAPLVARAGVEGSYLEATRRFRALDPTGYGAESADSLEGFLFPATYELKRGSDASDLVAKQVATFKREFEGVDLTSAKRKNLTAYDVLIIASLVEREAQLERERPLIASVIYNRLKEGIPLGIDATIRYATRNWQKPLTQSELAIDSPYNTRIRDGLPPTPIGSPGIDSIRAAARPARTRFLYYVVKPNTCGEHEFTRTFAEFEDAQARYEAEREKRGGRSPTDC